MERSSGTITLKGRTPTADEKRHMNTVAEIGCIVCRNKGFINPAEIHHLDGRMKKGCHFKVLPLCYEHHRGGRDTEPISRHPYKKRFENKYGTEEKLLEQVDDILLLIEQVHTLDNGSN